MFGADLCVAKPCGSFCLGRRCTCLATLMYFSDALNLALDRTPVLQLAEAEASASRAARENVRLAGLLDDEQAAREVLEEQVSLGLGDAPLSSCALSSQELPVPEGRVAESLMAAARKDS